MTTATQVVKALVTAAGAAVLSGTLDLPERGAWQGWFVIDADAPPAAGSSVTVTIVSQKDGATTTTFTGTVTRSSSWQGRSQFWMVAGTGGLEKPVNPRSYAAGPLPLKLTELVGDIVTECGETLTGGLSLDGYSVGNWSRANDGDTLVTGTQALNRLCNQFGLCWRFNPDGTLWVGPLAYPVDTQLPYMIEDDGITQTVTIAPDTATILPATTVLGYAFNRIRYELSPSGLRVTCFYGNSLRNDLRALVRGAIPELPYFKPYKATVVSQNSNTGQLQVLCDDPNVGVLDNVVLLAGGPGHWCNATRGQRVSILFASADPRLYFAVGFEMDKAATKGIARVSDSVSCGYLSGTAPSGGGAVQFSLSSSPSMTAVQIAGTITSGSNDQKLR